MKFSLFTDEFKQEAGLLRRDLLAKTDNGPTKTTGALREPVVIASETKQSSNFEVETSSTYLAPLRRTPWKFNVGVLPTTAFYARRGFRIVLIITLLTALTGASTAYILLKTALADTVINKYLDHQITSGLVGHWTFDGQDITSTTVLDKSGNGNDGTMTNMATSSRVAGKLGQGLQFDGVDNIVVLPNSPSVRFTNNATISSWVYLNNSWSANGQIFIKNTDQGGTYGWGMQFFVDSSRKPTFYIVHTDGGDHAHTFTSNTVLATNRWIFLTGVWDGTNLKIFIDGVHTDTSNIGSGTMRVNANGPGGGIGANNNVASIYDEFNGSLDDVRIYNRALSEREIKRLYKLGEGVKFNVSPNTVVDDGLVGHWTFDGQDMFGDRTGSTTDKSGNGNIAEFNFTNSFPRVGGKLGQAVKFSLVSTAQYVFVNPSSTINDLNSLTFTAWIRPTSLGDNSLGYIISKKNTCLSSTGWYLNLTSNNNLNFFRDFSGTDGTWQTNTNTVRLNEWQFVAVTYNNTSASNNPTLFVNGIEQALSETGTPTGSANSESTYSIFLGDCSTYSRTFDGSLDDVRIYNRILSADEIAQLYGSGQGVTVNATPAFTCGVSTVSDADGNVYNTLQIGTQCWMKQNMRVGTMVTAATTQTNNSTIEKHCYSDTLANCMTNNNPNYPDGGLYQWNEAMQYVTSPGARGICPSGWHIPTHDEFTTLERAVCTSGSCATDFPYNTTTTGYRGTNEGTKLKPNGTSGFEANLAGYSFSKTFSGRSTYGDFWSSSETGASVWYREVGSAYSPVYRDTVAKTYGFLVRCLKD